MLIKCVFVCKKWIHSDVCIYLKKLHLWKNNNHMFYSFRENLCCLHFLFKSSANNEEILYL